MPSVDLPLLPPREIVRLDADFPSRRVDVGRQRCIAMRDNGADGVTLVCLHGIGSGAASWQQVAARLQGVARVIAWDAPGYGASTPLLVPEPSAKDYAERLHEWLDALDVQRCILVGHSLGALMAAAAASAGGMRGSRGAARFEQVVLISPARGYGADAQRADSVRDERLETLARLGIGGMAAQRSQRLLSDAAGELARQWVRWNMARLNPAGYRQAIELLCGDDLLGYLPLAAPTQVWVGGGDVITPPAACAEVALAADTPLRLLGSLGHASYVEQPEAVAELLAGLVQEQQGRTTGSLTQ